MKHIKKVEIDSSGKITEEEFRSDELDYTVERREWVTSDGCPIREFTINEYVFHDPIDPIVIPYNICKDRKIDVAAYCREYRMYYAKNAQGKKLLNFFVTHDYKK